MTRPRWSPVRFNYQWCRESTIAFNVSRVGRPEWSYFGKRLIYNELKLFGTAFSSTISSRKQPIYHAARQLQSWLPIIQNSMAELNQQDLEVTEQNVQIIDWVSFMPGTFSWFSFWRRDRVVKKRIKAESPKLGRLQYSLNLVFLTISDLFYLYLRFYCHPAYMQNDTFYICFSFLQ